MSEVMAWLAALLILLGAVFTLFGAIGLLRLPDGYTRMHAASKAGALGAALILSGLALASGGDWALKAVIAVAVLLATAPLAAHAIARAAHRAGCEPVVGAQGDALREAQRDGRAGAQPDR